MDEGESQAVKHSSLYKNDRNMTGGAASHQWLGILCFLPPVPIADKTPSLCTCSPGNLMKLPTHLHGFAYSHIT